MILVVLLFIFKNFNCFTLNLFTRFYPKYSRFVVLNYMSLEVLVDNQFGLRFDEVYNFVFFLAVSLDLCFVLDFGLFNWISYKFPFSRFFELNTRVEDLDEYSELAFVTVAFRTLYAEKGNKKLHLYAYIYIVNGMCGVFFFCFFGWTLSVLPHNNFKCTTFLGDRYSMNFPIKHEFNAHEQTKYELYICLFIQLLNWFTAIGIFDVRSFPYNNYMNAHTTREIYRSLFIYY